MATRTIRSTYLKSPLNELESEPTKMNQQHKPTRRASGSKHKATEIRHAMTGLLPVDKCVLKHYYDHLSPPGTLSTARMSPPGHRVRPTRTIKIILWNVWLAKERAPLRWLIDRGGHKGESEHLPLLCHCIPKRAGAFQWASGELFKLVSGMRSLTSSKEFRAIHSCIKQKLFIAFAADYLLILN